MSVTVPKRYQAENFQTGQAADKLLDYTHAITKNTNYFPKSERLLLAHALRKLAMEICDLIWAANDVPTDNRTDFERRLRTQQKAYEDLQSLLRRIRWAYNWRYISGHQLEAWTGMIDETRSMLYNWRRSDKRRYDKLYVTEGDVHNRAMLRSPNPANANNVRNVRTDGSLNNNNANNGNGRAADRNIRRGQTK